MRCVVTLEESYKEIKFEFSSFGLAAEFMETALSHSAEDIKVSIAKEGEQDELIRD